MLRVSLAALVLAASVSVAEASPPLDPDLAALRDVATQPVRTTLLGWTADHRVVYRSLICSDDAGGGRGPWCELAQCTARATPADGTAPEAFGERDDDDCTMLVALDLNEGPDPRRTIDDRDLRARSAAHLASLGALAAGKRLATGTIRPVVGGGTFELARSGKAGRGRVGILHYREIRVDDLGAQLVHGVEITSVSRSPDGSCVAALGRFVIDGSYEGVPTATPRALARVVCDR